MSIIGEFETLAGRVLKEHRRVASLQVVRVAPSPVGPLVEWTGGPTGSRAETIEDGVTFRGGPSAQALLAGIARFLACRWRHGPPVPSPDWDTDLARRHPAVFQDPPSSQAGWSWLWESGAERIEEAGVPTGFCTQQTKEKFGTARWHYHADEDAPIVDEIVETVEQISAHVCEKCGAPGMLRQGTWFATLCELHAKETGR
jgi:hypothetical protein